MMDTSRNNADRHMGNLLVVYPRVDLCRPAHTGQVKGMTRSIFIPQQPDRLDTFLRGLGPRLDASGLTRLSGGNADQQQCRAGGR